MVQLTPPGSACSIGLGTGLAAYEAEPGTVRALHLVVDDIEKARAELLGRGVEMGEIEDVGGGVRYAGFTDPDGNSWTLQEMAVADRGAASRAQLDPQRDRVAAVDGAQLAGQPPAAAPRRRSRPAAR